mmetsp:Transcript_24564/g.36045  ORF Transcript_24564/g.36045 Transcript_24564/m.36045 type:complete len:375 (+) Transcript_24564:66-1190(+)|eukprot:CAMPEP_0195528020 /NCGR_PEP_ID=MMETSP0794_2-20130614/29991_1 /TAXON_ID=515487 /ORGANISM="Stephanopyxis turris, Strain CCMP 815" /LENGTH=374 /DNA_ID=CAMNT_0040659063 /DNA_START=63 /DNA_END=1187 /DNA_ORIENTATION=+
MRVAALRQLVGRHVRPVRCTSSRGFSAVPEPKDFDWDSLGFALNTKDTIMSVNVAERGQDFLKENNKLVPYGPLDMEPAATVINYGQSVFEGLKAMRADDGTIVMFRPDKNAERMQDGCRHYLMPEPSKEVFLDAVENVVRANAHWVPPGHDGGAFYMRPLTFGSGSGLGVGPSPEFSFIVFGSPVGAYFKLGGKVQGIRLLASSQHDRAARLGVGHIKAAGNYAQVFHAQAQARADGYNDVLFLDAEKKMHIEEVAAANFFCVVDGVLLTPKLGTILPGITRDAIITVARDAGLQVEETDITLKDVAGATEAFCAGTAAVVTPIASITSSDAKHDIVFPEQTNSVCDQIRKAVLDIQYRRVPDPYGWIHEVQF